MLTFASPLKILLILCSHIYVVQQFMEGIKCGEIDYAVPSIFFSLAITGLCFILPTSILAILLLIFCCHIFYFLKRYPIDYK